MAIHKITATWKKVLERQPRPATLLITFSPVEFFSLFIRLGPDAPGYEDADILWDSERTGCEITLSIPPNTPVYARTSAGPAYISCTIIKEMEEE